MKTKQKKTIPHFSLFEGNIIEYPIFSMERKGSTKVSETYSWLEQSTGLGVIKRQVTVNCIHGIPRAFDMDVFCGIMRLFYEQRKQIDCKDVKFTLYELARALDMPLHSGAVFDRIKDSLQRLASTILHFEDSFLTKAKKITIIVHLIKKLEIHESLKGNRSVNIAVVSFDEAIIASIEDKYYKLINHTKYMALSSGIARRLYTYLEKKRYQKKQFCIAIKKLGEKIPLKTHKISQIKTLLNKANLQLIKENIIEHYAFKGDLIVYYFVLPEQIKKIKEKQQQLDEQTSTDRYDTVFSQMSSDEQKLIEQQAEDQLLAKGTLPEFMVSSLLKIERNNILAGKLSEG